MAVVQYTGIVNQLRGKLNGSVFNKGRNSFTLQRKQQPPVGARGNQQSIRTRYSEVQRSWSELTVAQQNAWASCAQNNPATDRFGAPTILSGYNQYIKGQLYRLSVDLPLSPVATTGTVPSVSANSAEFSELSIVSNQFGESIISGHVIGSGGAASSQFRILCEISLPVSTGVTVYHRNFRRIGFGLPTNFSYNFSFNSNLGSKYPSVYRGAVLWLKTSYLQIFSGVIQGVIIQRFVVPTFESLSISSFTYDSGSGRIDLEVVYDPLHVGVPPFYSIRCYYQGNTPAPLTPEQLLNFRNPTMENDLRNSNHDDLLQTVAVGNWLSLRIDLLFAQTDEPISTSYRTIQNI